MLKLLHSIFGSEEKGSYPDSLVNLAIERAVDGTDPQIRAVSGYKKKLRPAVLRAIDHVVALVDQLPPVVAVTLGTTGEERPIRRFFISAEHMRKVFREDPALGEFLQGPGNPANVVSLMAMQREERGIFGAALSGEVVIHDVPQVTVSFDGHRFLDPSGDETETRRHMKRRAYDHLLTLALRRLTDLKSERSDLERRRALLEAKLNLLERKGWGFEEAAGEERISVTEVEDGIDRIERHLKELGGDDQVLERYLETVAEVLGHPDQYLAARSETIFVDRMGIKHAELEEGAFELKLYELYNAEGRTLVVTLVSINVEELRGV